MQFLQSLPAVALLSLALIGQGNAEARTSPPDGAVVVDASGEHGEYTTVQDGVDALSTTESGTQTLFIYPGVYNEQVYIAPREASIIVYGYTEDTSSYVANTVNITNNLSRNTESNNDATATLRAWAENLKVYNLNILNTFGHTSSNGQNLALSASTGSQGYYGVGLYGYQDTLLANEGKQLYAHSKIVGAIDFIFGQRGEVWLENIDIETIAAGYITASGRNDTDNPSWYMITNSTVSGVNSTVDSQAGIDYLGRPWGEYARVVYQFTELSQVISPEGWSVWNPPPQERTCCVTFAEYQNTGAGSDGERADFSQQLSAPVERTTVLGEGYEDEWWVDMSYLS